MSAQNPPPPLPAYPGGLGRQTDDPSMEDILASIRRILNDGEPEPDADPAVAPPGLDEDVYVLDATMLVEEPTPMAAEEQAAAPAEAAAPMPEPTPKLLPAVPISSADPIPEAPLPEASLPQEPIAEEPLIAPAAAAAANASLGALVRVVAQRHTQVYRDGPTLEDMVREEIRPLVKEWLDEHLPPLVERMVRAEIERVTRA